MKRWTVLILTALLLSALCACGAEQPEPTQAPPETAAAATAVPEPTSPPEPMKLVLPAAAEGWQDSYIAFLEDNYDIFAALWPEGLTGVGFVDLDLDGTPEMVVFDLGASATLGVQLFDLVDGQVWCVSSVQESAAGAFGGEHFSKISVCASYFESFRLVQTEEGFRFFVESANGTLESSWDELIRFDCVDGVLTPMSVCGRYLENDVETGLVVRERYTLGGEQVESSAGYEEAMAAYIADTDMGYDAGGVFLWNDMNRYDTTYDGFLCMAEDAVQAYAPIDL